MTVTELLRAVAPSTYVRVHVFSKQITLAGKTGPRRTNEFVEKLRKNDVADAYVTAIYPLYHAEELYIECTNMLE